MHIWLAALVLLIAVCLSLILTWQFCLTLSLVFILTISTVFLGIIFVAWVHVFLSLNHKTGTGIEYVQKELDYFSSKLMNEFEESNKIKNEPPTVVLGRTLDTLLQQLLNYFIRDFVEYYLKQYAFETHVVYNNLKQDLWGAIQILHDRLCRMDYVTLIACEMVTKITNHFEKIREVNLSLAENPEEPAVLKLSGSALSEEKEIAFLQHVSEMFIMFLLPRNYSLSPTKYFLREIIACKALYVAIDILTDPDFFNQYVISYIESQKVTNLMNRKTFAYANTYEEFLKMVQKTEDLETVKRYRDDIGVKIMQATTLQNMKRAKGIDLDSEKNVSGISKAEINEAKKLKKYIEQLISANKECERRLIELGWDSGMEYTVLSLNTILENILGRRYLTEFLETMASQGLVGFWTAVEDLKTTNRKNWHQVGAEIFYTYIRNPTAEIKVDKNTKKRMEAFLLGDKGPEVFYEVQQDVVKTLENKYYQPFINSDYYKEMVRAIDRDEGITEVDKSNYDGRQMSSDSNSSSENNIHVGEHSNYARRKLNQMNEKLNNKTQALQALQSSLKPESRVLRMLEKEVEWLQGERRQLEAHLTRTEIWGENLGKWRAIVQTAEYSDEKELPYFVIVVHMLESDNSDEEETTSGWVVSRTLTQFQELHRKLRPLCSSIKGLELPSQTFKFLFGKSDRYVLEKAKNQIQKFLEFVLGDDRLNQSEAIYSFLSPSSDHLKQTAISPKKSLFSFSLFKSNSDSIGKDSNHKEVDDNELSQSLDTPGLNDYPDSQKMSSNYKLTDDSKDTIAEPLYSLMSEVFDMRGLFKYLRKTLIAFVQITYGRTINRQIYDTITWYFSEKMLHYYITTIIKTFWPLDTLAPKSPERSDFEKKITAEEAKKLFTTNVPELLNTLVGTSAARNGAKKVFNTLQNKKLNKQLFYELFQLLLLRAFPELDLEKL